MFGNMAEDILLSPDPRAKVVEIVDNLNPNQINALETNLRNFPGILNTLIQPETHQLKIIFN